MINRNFYHAYLKIERADEILDEIKKLLKDKPPYTYILETDTYDNQRATLAKVNKLSLDRLVIRCGELFHNLRSAIDQAYWEAVAPHVAKDKQKAIQFPFAKDAANLEQTIKSKQGDKVGQNFINTLKRLKPFFGNGGNTFLALLHEVNIVDKHKFPTPTGNFTKIDSSSIQKLVPDFPGGMVNCGAGRNRKDVVWHSRFYDANDIGEIVPPFMYLFHKTLNLPVETWFYIENPPYTGEIINTMNILIHETRTALDEMASGLS
jgi:hypothetical protein